METKKIFHECECQNRNGCSEKAWLVENIAILVEEIHKIKMLIL